MASLFPESTNAAYRGHPVSAWGLTLLAILTVVPGAIHAFLPDGGAGVIAGLDLTANAATIIGVFAWVGATQIVWGLTMLAVSLRYRSLVPLLLALILVERAIIALNQWVLKPGEGPDRPPEAYATLLLLPVVAVLLGMALKPRQGAAVA